MPLPNPLVTTIDEVQQNLQAIDRLLTEIRATEFSGTGSPENVVTAPIGARYRRLDGGAGTSIYVKETGAGNTGWVGK